MWVYYNPNPTGTVFHTSGDTEFLQAINGKQSERVLTVLNELVETVKILHPQMYQSLLDKLYNE